MPDRDLMISDLKCTLLPLVDAQERVGNKKKLFRLHAAEILLLCLGWFFRLRNDDNVLG